MSRFYLCGDTWGCLRVYKDRGVDRGVESLSYCSFKWIVQRGIIRRSYQWCLKISYNQFGLASIIVDISRHSMNLNFIRSSIILLAPLRNKNLPLLPTGSPENQICQWRIIHCRHAWDSDPPIEKHALVYSSVRFTNGPMHWRTSWWDPPMED